MDKVAGGAGTPAEPPAKNILKIKFPLCQAQVNLAKIEIFFS
jgi:hypothetical protein